MIFFFFSGRRVITGRTGGIIIIASLTRRNGARSFPRWCLGLRGESSLLFSLAIFQRSIRREFAPCEK